MLWPLADQRGERALHYKRAFCFYLAGFHFCYLCVIGTKCDTRTHLVVIGSLTNLDGTSSVATSCVHSCWRAHSNNSWSLQCPFLCAFWIDVLTICTTRETRNELSWDEMHSHLYGSLPAMHARMFSARSWCSRLHVSRQLMINSSFAYAPCMRSEQIDSQSTEKECVARVPFERIRLSEKIIFSVFSGIHTAPLNSLRYNSRLLNWQYRGLEWVTCACVTGPVIFYWM